MNILTFTIKDILRKKTRFILTLLGITVGLSVCIIMLGLSESIRESFKNAYSGRQIDVVVYEKDRFDILASQVDSKRVEQIGAYQEVASSNGVLFDFQKYKGRYLPLHGWDVDSVLFEKIAISQGRVPRAGSREVIIGDAFARNSGQVLGREITIKRKQFEVVGVFNSPVPFEKFGLIIPLDTLQGLDRKKQDIVIAIQIILEEPYRNKEGIAAITERIEKSFPELAAEDADLFVAEKTRQVILGEKLALLISVIAIVAVILGLSNTMIAAVFEKRKLMGYLLAMGWQKKDVFKMILIETLFIMTAGAICGAFIGAYATEHLFNMMDVSVFAASWNQLFIFKIAGIALASGVIAAMIPSIIIININPVAIIKNE